MKHTLFILMIFLTGISKAQTVTIGSQVWMTKNLDVASFRNGDPIPEAKTDEEWEKAGENKQPAWCYYNNDPANGAKYGKLYNWYAVNDPRGLAPNGFHIPSISEMEILNNFLGFGSGTKMKSKPIFQTNISYIEEGGYYETKWVPCNNCSYWTKQQKLNNPCTVCKNQGGKSVSTGKYIPKTKRKIEEKILIEGWEGWFGTNESGFSGIPGGMRDNDGLFRLIGEYGNWWGSTDMGDFYSSKMVLDYDDNMDCSRGSYYGSGLNVRCIKD